ncbi:glycosyltransferase family 9 protein [Chiayiivirga flava]|uniref:Heptosyltransferase I n=1 Tax=Chiayiivirga flava TaxID=659595 RepID=A0A7W8G2U3_9GAMM|nr:glycosyltransferase family 9 protein [Chiayiivirga flava]MBB5209060.1 heptosyltransferase I [Chiayiivirga flava]
MNPAPTPPGSLCLLRLSALGDATHVVPLVRTLQRAWPQTRLTWIIGKGERALLDGLPGVEFVTFDKKSGLAGVRALWRQLADRRFDALLQMQLAARANVLALGIRADTKIGYDRARSKEGHGLVVDRRIPPGGHHVLDVLGRFALPLGLTQDRVEWDLPVPQAARDWAAEQLPGAQPTLIVSPCSSHVLRNWRAERYAAVADHAARVHGYRIALCGGRSRLERDTADAILAAMREPAIDLVGRDTLKQLMALLERAAIVLSPDSGPVHIANALGTKVVGLFACTDTQRSGPYSDLRFSTDHYDAAARKFLRKPASALRWGKRVEFPGVMDLIEVDEVIDCIDRCTALLRGTQPAAAPR